MYFVLGRKLALKKCSILQPCSQNAALCAFFIPFVVQWPGIRVTSVPHTYLPRAARGELDLEQQRSLSHWSQKHLVTPNLQEKRNTSPEFNHHLYITLLPFPLVHKSFKYQQNHYQDSTKPHNKVTNSKKHCHLQLCNFR